MGFLAAGCVLTAWEAPVELVTFFRRPIRALAAFTTDSSHLVPTGKYPLLSIHTRNVRPSLPSGITTITLFFQFLHEPFPASRSN